MKNNAELPLGFWELCLPRIDKREKRVSWPYHSRGVRDTPLSLTTNEKQEISLMKLLQV